MTHPRIEPFKRQAYFARIDEVNLKGPELRAVLELNPSALSQAAAMDLERKVTGKRSDLHGIPILLKVGIPVHYWYWSHPHCGQQDNIGTIASEGRYGFPKKMSTG